MSFKSYDDELSNISEHYVNIMKAVDLVHDNLGPSESNKYAHALVNHFDAVCVQLRALDKEMLGGLTVIRDDAEFTNVSTMVRDATDAIRTGRFELSEDHKYTEAELVQMYMALKNFLLLNGRGRRSAYDYDTKVIPVLKSVGIQTNPDLYAKCYAYVNSTSDHDTVLSRSFRAFAGGVSASAGLGRQEKEVFPFIAESVIKLAYLLKAYAMRRGTA